VNIQPVTPPPVSQPGIDLLLAAIAFPAFTITCHPHGWRQPRWEAVRKQGTSPGLYAVITPDPGELIAILTTASTQHAQPSEPGLPR
jgi:hypothetical protein